MKFEWDRNKANLNYTKHGVSFEEASEVFYDYFEVIFDYYSNSINERREIIIGNSVGNKLLVVVFTERRKNIRIISARKATKFEKKEYEKTVKNNSGEIKEEYDFDYNRAKPNRFATVLREKRFLVSIDPDLAKVFKTEEQVNHALRSLLGAIPSKSPAINNKT